MHKDVKILFIILIGCVLATVAFTLAGNISTDPKEHWAWNDDAGWFNFGVSAGNVTVLATSVSGYATSAVGWLSLDCDTMGWCATSTYRILHNDQTGDLCGYAWNENYGWFSFNCDQNSAPCSGGGNTCATSSYKVYIQPDGYFRGFAWNDVLGWVSFNCIDPGICGTSDYKVKTTFISYPPPGPGGYSGILESSTFDTGYPDGVSFNSMRWKDVTGQSSECLAGGASVKFRFASANCSNGATNPPTCDAGGWGQGSGVGAFLGSDGTTGTFYGPVELDKPIAINKSFHNNHRYYRYRIYLSPNTQQSCSPTVTDVIVNYSP